MEHPGNKPPPKLSVVFRFWSDPPKKNTAKNTHEHSASVYRGNGPSTRRAFTSGCAGTGRANINQWSQEWNQGGRVVPHNAATGEVRERCTPCLVSVSMLLSTHAQAHVHARTRHPYSYVQSRRCIVHATASPSHAITWETNKRIHRCSRTHTLGGE